MDISKFILMNFLIRYKNLILINNVIIKLNVNIIYIDLFSFLYCEPLCFNVLNTDPL